MTKQTVSILICSRGRRNALERLVVCINNMRTDYAFEIVVVEETDEPKPIKDARYIPHPVADRGIPFARNLALKNAIGDIIVFVDDDCSIYGGWLDHLLSPFKEVSVLGVQGGVTAADTANAIGWAESILGFPGGGLGRIIDAQGINQKTIEVSTLNCAYRKWVIDKIGGFDESLKYGGEDYLLSKQVSPYGSCIFVPGALVGHAVRGSLIKIWRWFVRRGRAEVGVIRTGKYKNANFWSLMKSSFLIKIVALLIAGFIISDIFIIPVVLVAYLGLQYFRYFKTWKISKLPWHSLMILPLVKLIMDLAGDFGRFKGLIFD